MFKLVGILIFLTCNTFLYGQKIDYTIPVGIEKDINKEDYKKIVNHALPIIQKKYKIEFIKEGFIQLEKGQDLQGFNLDNLVLKCVETKDQNLWEEIIKSHFNQIFTSIEEEKKIDPKNFETIKKYLSLRIYTKEIVQQRGKMETLVFKIDLKGTYTLLMIDLPGAFKNVDKTMFELWKKDSMDIFKIAQSNVNKQIVEKVTQKYNVDGNEIEISLIGEENYAASYALDLQNNSPELLGEFGSIIAIPNKGLVNICKITKEKPLDFVKFIQTTKPLIEKSFLDHPQPISNDYFWFYKGEFIKVNIQTDENGKINIIAPFELSKLLATIK